MYPRLSEGFMVGRLFCENLGFRWAVWRLTTLRKNLFFVKNLSLWKFQFSLRIMYQRFLFMEWSPSYWVKVTEHPIPPGLCVSSLLSNSRRALQDLLSLGAALDFQSPLIVFSKFLVSQNPANWIPAILIPANQNSCNLEFLQPEIPQECGFYSKERWLSGMISHFVH